MNEASRREVKTRGGSGEGSPGGHSESPSLDTLAAAFRDLGLSRYEAAVLVVLLQLGSATASKIASASEVSRPNVYPALEALRSKGIVEVAPGKVNRWVCANRDEAADRLGRAEHERLREEANRIQSRTDEARRMLLALAPATAEAPLPYARLIAKAAEASTLYTRCIAEATTEILVTNRGPYVGTTEVRPEVLDAIGRGLKIRALYQSNEIENPFTEQFLATVEAYHRAGVEGRIVDDVGVPVVICDKRLVLIALDDPIDPQGVFPTTIVADHPGMASYCTTAFEHLWAAGRPVDQEHHFPVSSDAAGGPSPR